MITDRDILQAALIGYQSQLAQIEAQIANIQSQLGAKPAAAAAPAAPKTTANAGPRKAKAVKTAARKKRVLSAEARANMAAGQKRRWAARNAAK